MGSGTITHHFNIAAVFCKEYRFHKGTSVFEIELIGKPEFVTHL